MRLTDAQLRDAVRNTHKASCEACRKTAPGYMEAYARLHQKPDDMPIQHDLKSDTDHE